MSDFQWKPGYLGYCVWDFGSYLNFWLHLTLSSRAKSLVISLLTGGSGSPLPQSVFLDTWRREETLFLLGKAGRSRSPLTCAHTTLAGTATSMASTDALEVSLPLSRDEVPAPSWSTSSHLVRVEVRAPHSPLLCCLGVRIQCFLWCLAGVVPLLHTCFMSC